MVQRLVQREFDGLQFQATRLDLGEIQNVVDHTQERFRRGLDGQEVVALLRAEVGIQRQLCHPDDAVHRRADFVAHVR